MSSKTLLQPSTLALLLLPPLFWAGNAVVGRLMVGQVPPLQLSFLRWLLALLAVLPWTAAPLWRQRAALWPLRGPLLRMALLGIACYNSLQYVALHTTTPLNVTLISAAIPIFILLSGRLLHAQVIARSAWLGAALSCGGVLVVVSHGNPELLLQLRLARGDLVMLLAVALWSIYTWELRRHPLPLKPLQSLAAQMLLGTAMIAPFAAWELWGQGLHTHWSAGSALAIAYVALLPSLLAYACWGVAVARVGAQIPAYFGNLMPLFAALLSWLFLHQGIEPSQLAGAVLIFSGIHVALRG